jgi:hypothetical protein
VGAWGVGNFDNDDAADWVSELCESTGLASVTAALQAVISQKYIEAPECSTALAAAEVIAALSGRPLASLPEGIVAWVRANSVVVDKDLVSMALKAIHRIETESELKELWEESDELTSWMATLENLRERLGAA